MYVTIGTAAAAPSASHARLRSAHHSGSPARRRDQANSDMPPRSTMPSTAPKPVDARELIDNVANSEVSTSVLRFGLRVYAVRQSNDASVSAQPQISASWYTHTWLDRNRSTEPAASRNVNTPTTNDSTFVPGASGRTSVRTRQLKRLAATSAMLSASSMNGPVQCPFMP